MKPGAPVVNETYPKNTFTYHDVYDHQKIRFGDVERGFAAADHILEQRYQMSPIEHAPTETNGSIAAPDTNGRYVVYTSTQALFFSLDTCAKILDVPVEQAAFHRRHGRGRVRRQGRHRHRAALDPRRDADRTAGPLHDRPRGGDAVLRSARRRAHFHQGRDWARRTHCRAQVPLPVRQRRLYPPFELRRRQMRRPSAGAVHDPERFGGRLLRVHQSGAGDRHARLRRHRGRFRHRMPDGQARPSRRHGPDGVPHPQRLSRRRHEGPSARGEEHRAHRMRAGRGGEGQMAHPRRFQAHVVAQGRRRDARRRAGDAARARADPGRAPRRPTAAHRLRSPAPPPPPEPIRPPPPPPPAARRRRLTARCGSRRCSAQGGDKMAKLRGRGMCVDQLSHRHESRRRSEPGARPFQSERQVHRVAVLDRSRAGHEIGDAPDLRRNARRAGRGRLCRYRRFRHRPPLHGQLRLARHAPGRQRGHGGGARGARRDDGGGGRGTRGQRRRPRDRRARQHPRQGRAAPLDLDQGRRHRRAVQAGQDDFGPRHLSRSPVRGRSGDRGDVAGDLLRPRLHRRRSRGRRRDRRSGDGEDGQRLRTRPGAQSAPRRAAARRRRLDGRQPRPLRDDRSPIIPIPATGRAISSST